MTRFGIDAATALRLVREGLVVPDHHSLVGPTLLRSDALASLYVERRALVESDPRLAALATGVVPTAPFDDLLR